MKTRTENRLSGADSPRLNQHLERRILSYALAVGAGAFVAGRPAQADIVYTPAHTWVGRGSTVQIDLNHDGHFDVALHRSSTFFSTGFFLRAGALGKNGFANKATPLNAGAPIGASRTFVRSEQLASAYNYAVGPWANVKDRFLGIEFHFGGQTYYGWAELSVDADANTDPEGLHLDTLLEGYAYNTIPNQRILAGQTSAGLAATPTPEAGTLGLLALGAQGIPVWRRKIPADGEE
jgi:hypothetical protein